VFSVSDLEFSSTVAGTRRVPFASAGDCYSTNNCPQVRQVVKLTFYYCFVGVLAGQMDMVIGNREPDT